MTIGRRGAEVQKLYLYDYIQAKLPLISAGPGFHP